MNEETKNESQRKTLRKIVSEISKDNMDKYYGSTSDTASEIADAINNKTISLTQEEHKLVSDLKVKDISMLLSINNFPE